MLASSYIGYICIHMCGFQIIFKKHVNQWKQWDILARSASVSSDYSLILATLLSVLLIFYRRDLQKLERLNKKKWRVREIGSVIHFPLMHESPRFNTPWSLVSQDCQRTARREVMLLRRILVLSSVLWNNRALGSLLNNFSEGCFCLSSGEH